MGSGTTSAITNPTPLATYSNVDSSADATVNQLKSGSTTLFGVEVDNSAANSTKVYVCLFNLAGASVTLGTTVPTVWFPVAAGARVRMTLWLTSNEGLTFGTGLTVAVCNAPVSNTGPSVKPTVQVDYT